MDPTGYMRCELEVDTKAAGWDKTLTKVLKSVKGVSYIIDTETRIAHVSGKIDPGTLLMNLAKAGKHAELRWVEFDWHHHHQYTPSASPAGLMATDMVDGYGYGSDGHGAYCDHHGYRPYLHDYYGRMMDPYPHPYYSSYNDLPQPHFLQAPPVPENSSFYDPDRQCTIM